MEFNREKQRELSSTFDGWGVGQGYEDIPGIGTFLVGAATTRG